MNRRSRTAFRIGTSIANRTQTSVTKSPSFFSKCICVLLFASLLSASAAFGQVEDLIADPAADPANKKQLKDLFRDIFGGKKNNRPQNPRRAIPGGGIGDANGSRDPIDSRAPRDVRVEQLMQTADDATKKKDFKTAIDLYQRLLDQPEDSLSHSTTGKWQSARQTANERLGQLPETVLTEYRSQYGGLAQQLLQSARRSGQAADFVGVATRFFHTPAGYEAAQYLATQHFDKSEFELAARWFSELAASPAAVNQQDAWLVQAAFALTKAGDTEGAAALIRRLSAGPETYVALGSTKIKASEFLSHTSDVTALEKRSLSDWIQLYGTAARTGTAIGGDPLLTPNWTVPLTASHSVRNSIKWLAHDLQDQHRSMILAAQPLAVNGRVIYRDLRGLRCVDIERGETIWEGIEGVSAERILSGFPLPQSEMNDNWRFQGNPFPNQNDYQGMSAEYSPLTSLLFRDGTYGLISSDGERVFVVEDYGILSMRQPGQNWGWDGTPEHNDAYGVPWKTNRLAAYDLRTGRALWSVGGIQSNESFDLPLSGSYIHGTPVVDGTDLFLVASKGEEVRLWALDSKLGQPKWSQLIAFSDTKIDQDLARRWIAAQVSVGRGIVVCPTSVGWLVAVDRMRQSVLWAYRYSPREQNVGERDSSVPLLVQRELNGAWCPSAPVISDSRVIFTPQDEPVLICLSAVDGQLLWQKPKETGLYLAGVFDQLAIVVGESDVSALKLSDGNVAWKSEFRNGIRPSGRCVVVEDRIYLPLNSGELRVIQLKTGTVASKTYVASAEPALGNIAMHRGQLVSLGLSGMTAFGQRDAIFEEIQQRLAANPEDAQALLRSSEIQLMNRDYAAALPLLRKVAVDRLSNAEQARHRSALVECLSVLTRDDPKLRNEEFAELGGIVSSPAEILAYNNLIVEKLTAEKRSADAFDKLTELVTRVDNQPISAPSDREWKLKPLFWISGRMQSVWSEAIESERQRIDDLVVAKIREASSGDLDSLQRVATLFAFHPAGIDVLERFVERLIEAKDFAGAQLELERLAEFSNHATAARATERLARLMILQKQPKDAVYYFSQLESKFGDTVVRDGRTGEQLVRQVRDSGELDFAPHLFSQLWQSTTLKVDQSMINFAPQSQDVAHETSLPFFSNLGLEYHQNEQRLAFESAATGQVEWMVPLHGALRVADDGYLTASHIGHQMYFVSRGVLHAISPVERRILWTKTLDNGGDGNLQLRNDSRQMVSPMSTAGRDESSPSLLLQKSMTMGNLVIVRPGYLCLYGRRSLTLLNPRTGEEIWQRDGLPVNAQIIGNREAIFVVSLDRADPLAYRASDGKPLDVPRVGKFLSNALMASGSSFLLFEQPGAPPLATFGIRRSKTAKSILRLFDPVTHKTEWQLEYPAGTLVNPLGQSELILAKTDGHLERLEISTGKVTNLEVNPQPHANPKSSEKFLLADDDRIYLIANEADFRNHWFGENLASVRAHGWITAWSRRDNRFLWSQRVEHQNLVIDRFSTMPVLLFVSRSLRQQRGDMGVLNIEAIHKQTGNVLIDSKIASTYTGFHALEIKPQIPSIELKSYNGRLRLTPADEAVSPDSND